MTKAVRIWLVLTVLLSLGTPALAQCELKGFVDGGPMLNRDMTWGDRTISNAGVTFGGGVRIGARTEVRLLVEVPPVTVIQSSHDEQRGNPPNPPVIVRVTDTARIRNRTMSAIVTRLFPAGRRSAVTASVGWSRSRRVADPISSSWGGFVVGFGGIVGVTGHLAIVPEARVIWSGPWAESGSVILRTGLAARWTI
jgi:hypothetical protein